MRAWPIALAILGLCVFAGGNCIRHAAAVDPYSTADLFQRSVRPGSTQRSSLCSPSEHVVFNCTVSPAAKIVSLCASRDLDREHGYLQYRFGLPGKIELEFPKDRKGTQDQFRYSHYFRYQVDLTEISFTSDGYEYTVFDNYNGEGKPRVSEQGVSITAPGKAKETNLICRSKARADYGVLQDVLPNNAP